MKQYDEQQQEVGKFSAERRTRIHPMSGGEKCIKWTDAGMPLFLTRRRKSILLIITCAGAKHIALQPTATRHRTIRM